MVRVKVGEVGRGEGGCARVYRQQRRSERGKASTALLFLLVPPRRAAIRPRRRHLDPALSCSRSRHSPLRPAPHCLALVRPRTAVAASSSANRVLSRLDRLVPAPARLA